MPAGYTNEVGTVDCSTNAANASGGYLTKVIPIGGREAFLTVDAFERLPRTLDAQQDGRPALRNDTLDGPVPMVPNGKGVTLADTETGP